MVDITGTSVTVAAAGVLAGVVYYLWDMGHQFKARQTDVIMGLHSQVVSKEFMDANPLVDLLLIFAILLSEYSG